MIGRALVGMVADQIGPLNTYIVVFILSGVVQYALWLTATTFGGIIGYVAVYGLIAPGYIGILPQIVVQLFGPDNLATNVGLVLLFNCPGNFICGPMGSALFEMTGRTSFKWVVIVGGALQIAGGCVAMWCKSLGSLLLIEEETKALRQQLDSRRTGSCLPKCNCLSKYHAIFSHATRSFDHLRTIGLLSLRFVT